MRIAVAKEIEVCERRVALIPDIVARLVKQGVEVSVETGAGERAFFNAFQRFRWRQPADR